MFGNFIYGTTTFNNDGQGAQFCDEFNEIAALQDIKVDTAGIEAYNVIGISERYHTQLRNTYRRLKIDHPSIRKDLLLQLSVKAMNDTLGTEGLVQVHWCLEHIQV